MCKALVQNETSRRTFFVYSFFPFARKLLFLVERRNEMQCTFFAHAIFSARDFLAPFKRITILRQHRLKVAGSDLIDVLIRHLERRS